VIRRKSFSCVHSSLIIFLTTFPMYCEYSINKPGGCAKITKIHYDAGSTVEGLDVKYVVSGGVEKNIDPAIVSAFETLQRGGRKRRGRDFLLDQAKDAKQKLVKSSKKNKTKKTKAPSPQPTSPSTPTTSPGQQRKQQQQPKATKVTPIPSYVIANQIMDVSPLDRNCNPSTEQSKQPLARRGLFETTNVPPATAVRTKEEKQAAAAVASYLFNSSSEEKRKSIIKSANLKPPAVYETPATNNNDNNHRKANRMPLHTTTSMRASVAKLQLPRPQPKTAANSKSVPLRRVFQKEVQKAREFIDTVMGARSEDLIHDHQQEAEEEVVVKAPAPPSYVAK
jgi:hypothetical protein